MTKVSVEKAAKSLGVCKETVRRMCRNGQVKAVKVGSNWRVLKKSGEIVLSNSKNK